MSWLVPAHLPSATDGDDVRSAPLDLDAAIAHYGADTAGGVGVSVPAIR